MTEDIKDNERQKAINELLLMLKEGEKSVKSPEDWFSYDEAMHRLDLATPYPPLTRGDAACRR